LQAVDGQGNTHVSLKTRSMGTMPLLLPFVPRM